MGILNPAPYERLLRPPLPLPVSLPTREGLAMRLLSFHLIRCKFSLDLSLVSSLDDELFSGRCSVGLSSLFSFFQGLLSILPTLNLHLVPAGLSSCHKSKWRLPFLEAGHLAYFKQADVCVQKGC